MNTNYYSHLSRDGTLYRLPCANRDARWVSLSIVDFLNQL